MKCDGIHSLDNGQQNGDTSSNLSSDSLELCPGWAHAGQSDGGKDGSEQQKHPAA